MKRGRSVKEIRNFRRKKIFGVARPAGKVQRYPRMFESILQKDNAVVYIAVDETKKHFTKANP